jgi:hypothetical protein
MQYSEWMKRFRVKNSHNFKRIKNIRNQEFFVIPMTLQVMKRINEEFGQIDEFIMLKRTRKSKTSRFVENNELT